MKDGKSPGSLEICAALSLFPLPFCLACSPVGLSLLLLFLFLLIRQINDDDEKERPKITSKITDGPEKQNKCK